MNLGVITQHLYGLTPTEFTADRDAEATKARTSGDRELAAAIKQLKRPSAAAWLANSLVRQCPRRVDELLSLGDRLRDAERRMAGSEMKDLARTAHRVVAELVADAERLASAARQRPSASALRQLQETLNAAMVDPGAAQALRGGQLTVALSYAGLGAFVDEAATAETEADRERAAAKQARDDLHATETHAAELAAELQSAHRRRDRLRDQMEDMERQLRQVRAQESEVDERIQQLEAAVAAATNKIECARSLLPSKD